MNMDKNEQLDDTLDKAAEELNEVKRMHRTNNAMLTVTSAVMAVAVAAIAFTTVFQLLSGHSGGVQKDVDPDMLVQYEQTSDWVETDADGERYVFFLPYFDHKEWQEWESVDGSASTVCMAVDTIRVNRETGTAEYVFSAGGSIVVNPTSYVFTTPDGSVEHGQVLSYVFAMPYDDFEMYANNVEEGAVNQQIEENNESSDVTQ